jgi:anti-anti-sigma regulatory factor
MSGADAETGVDLEVDAIGGVLAITAHGRLVRDAIAALAECLAKATAGGRPVVLDLLDVDAIDPHGVRLLEAAHIDLGARLRLVVRRRGPVHLALKERGLAHAFAVHASAVSALAAAAPAAPSRRFARGDAEAG